MLYILMDLTVYQNIETVIFENENCTMVLYNRLHLIISKRLIKVANFAIIMLRANHF